MKKVFKIIYYLFLAGLGAVAVLLIVSIFPLTGNYQFKIVRSGSMEPSIKTGSVVMVKPAHLTGSRQANYKIGDVITFNSTAKTKDPITHRIVEMRVDRGNPVYITKGDANEEADTREVRQKEVIGKVLFNIPYLGYAVAAAQKPWGFAALIIIPAVIIIFDQITKIWKEASKLKRKNEAV